MTTSRPGREAGPARAGAVLMATADPIRRQLLAALAARGPLTATELVGGLPITRQGVAMHLDVLSRANVVTSSKHGRDVRFAVRTDGLFGNRRLAGQMAAEWDTRLAAIKRIAEAPVQRGSASNRRG